MRLEAASIVGLLSSALDRDDFAAAAVFVHPECVYDSPGGRIVGREVIIDSYRKNAVWARSAFDQIEFESGVEPMDDGRFLVTYTDKTWHTPRMTGSDDSSHASVASTQTAGASDEIIRDAKPLAHVYQCQQILSVGEDGLITHIEHVEIPGQREALEIYFKTCGVVRPH